ncbi:MAG: acyl-CoA desaturase [Bernardetiaceae bacterium]|nr:acyl-CoA desaturase [Bernardetiaceae bacterium]
MQNTVKFTDRSPEKALFYQTVKKRVDEYFRTNNLSKNANTEMVLKTVLFLGGAVVLYSLIMSGNFGLWTMLGLAMLLGAFKAFIGFNVSHDATHGSYSKHDSINNLLALTFNLAGANADVWRVTHNTVHHMYTNIPGHDEDIEVAPGLVRLSTEDKLTPIMRYQHYYAFLLYGLASISWVFRKDYIKFFKPRIGAYDNSKHTALQVFNLFFFKALYYTLFIVLPLVFLPITWWQFIIGFVAMHLIEGWVLGLVFQLAHVVEGTDFPMPNDKGNIEENWAIHQMHTTANFARTNRVANFLCGGLNFQIEHHLFPKVCHVHYTALSKIVKKTAEEFNVPYIDNPTFIGALKSHYNCLKAFGKEALEAQENQNNNSHQNRKPKLAEVG